MKCEINLGNLKFIIEGAGEKEVFKELARVQEVFGHKVCGACKSPDTRYVVRTVDDNEYYEQHCNKCGCKLAFGAHKKGGTLFPKRKNDEGYLPHNGWHKWEGKKDE